MELSITMEDLTKEQRHIAEIVGIDRFIELSKLLGGTYVYFPTFDAMSKGARNRAIRDEFNGGNHKELAVKYGVSTITIRRLCD